MRPIRYAGGIPEHFADYFNQITVPELWDRNAAEYPNKEAVVDPQTRVTWAQAKRWTDRVALGLVQLGLLKDDVVALQVPSIVEAVLLRVAFRKAGIIGVILESAFRERELQYILDTTNAVGVAILPSFRGRDYLQTVKEMHPHLPKLKYIFVVGDDVPEGTISIKEMARRPLDEHLCVSTLAERTIGRFDVSEVLTTAGTTGMPRLVESTNSHYLSGVQLIQRWKLNHDDVFGLLSPHSGGVAFTCFCPSLTLGAKLVMMPSFNAEEALKLIESERVTCAVGVPTQLEMMVKHPNLGNYDLSSLHIFCTSGAYVSPATVKEAEEKMNCHCVVLYGGVEIDGFSITCQDDPPEVRQTSVGKAFTYNQGKVVDDEGNEVPTGQIGELVCSSPNNGGFYRNLEATLEAWGGKPDGWFKTGDLARADEEGNLYIAGRIKDIIKRGGYPIAPAEIENLLKAHPKLQGVAIVPMPDPTYGEKACAYVIPAPGQDFTFEEMVSYLKEKKIASYKLPERLEIVDKFPMARGEKISKRKLTEDITRKLRAEGKIH